MNNDLQKFVLPSELLDSCLPSSCSVGCLFISSTSSSEPSAMDSVALAPVTCASEGNKTKVNANSLLRLFDYLLKRHFF